MRLGGNCMDRFKKKVQYEDNNLKVCAPDSLNFIVKDIVDYFNKNVPRVLNFYHLKNYPQYHINLFDDLQKFRDFIVFEMRNGNNTLPSYAIGTYDKGMCNQFLNLKKDDHGIYRVINNNVEYIDDRTYRRRISTPIHELVHIIYSNSTIHGNPKLRVVWIDEGLAQNLSGEYDYLKDDFKRFIKFYCKVKNETKYLPKLKGLKHGKDFVNENYNLYSLSYLAVRYLFEIMSQDEIYEIVMSYEKSNEIGESILNDMFRYYDVLIESKSEEEND